MLLIRDDGAVETGDEACSRLRAQVTRPCPFCERAGATYALWLHWEECEPLEEGDNSTHVFWMECGCGARGPIARTPDQAAAFWEGGV